MTWARALATDDSERVLLIRKHKHLIKPYQNDYISRRRSMTHGTFTGVGLFLCLYGGYSYGRIKHDEVVRRRFYSRYANCMSIFDYVTPIFE